MKIGDKVIGTYSTGFIHMTHHTTDNKPIHQVIWKGGFISWEWEENLLLNLRDHRDNILSELLNI